LARLDRRHQLFLNHLNLDLGDWKDLRENRSHKYAIALHAPYFTFATTKWPVINKKMEAPNQTRTNEKE
jgi:hypothetical protein